MSRINRREFLAGAAAAVTTAMTGCTVREMAPPASRVLRANDVVTLGRTGIRTSRLSIGTGAYGGSEVRRIGIEEAVRLLRHGFDEGVRWWDVADVYRTHPHAAAALKELPRDQVTITTKVRARLEEKGYNEIKADIERCRKELNTDYIDICLMHCMMEADWPEKMKGRMDALSEAKEKGHVRAVGCSYHNYDALKAAAHVDWVDVNLVRLNPYALHMDVEKKEQVPAFVETLRQLHAKGQSLYGMKIIGQGDLVGDQIDASLRFALSQPFLSGFTVGFSSTAQIDDIVRRIDRVRIQRAAA